MANPASHDLQSSFEYTFTVFTPTYNRAGTLPVVYESLCGQTFSDFEWVIVDDDSEDNTAALVDEWKREAEFPIRFHVQDQSGKHIAINRGVDLAAGRFLVELDSDDTIRPEALERFAEIWTEIPPSKRDRVLGVNALSEGQDGNVIGDEFPKDGMFADYFELRYKFTVQGEGIGFVRTDVMDQYRFPEISGVRYIPESYIWSQIADDGYLKYCKNDVLGTYRIADDTEDQLTQSSNLRDSRAFVLWHRHRLNTHLNWFMEEPQPFFVSAAGYVKHSVATGIGLREQVKNLNSWEARLLWAICLPVGLLVYYLRYNR